MGPSDILESMKDLKIDVKGLFSGGVFDDNESARRKYTEMAIVSNEKRSEGGYTVTQNAPDPVSAGFISQKAIYELKEVKSVKTLQAGKINKGVFIWVTVVESVCRLVGICALVEDSLGQLFPIGLYNFVRDQSSNAECQKHIPLGSRIAFKEPYLKCFQSGKLGLRVDNPGNVKIELPALNKERGCTPNNKITSSSSLSRYVQRIIIVCFYIVCTLIC